MHTEVPLDTVEMDMPDCRCKPVIRDSDQVFYEARPLVLYAVYWQSYITHLQSLRVQLIVSVGMILMERPNR